MRQGEGESTIRLEDESGKRLWLQGERLTGSSADNALSGGRGDDKLYFSFGSDTLDGGAGSDTLFASKALGAYSVSVRADSTITLTDGSSSSVISNVETFVFDDGSYSLAKLITLFENGDGGDTGKGSDSGDGRRTTSLDPFERASLRPRSALTDG